MEQNKLISLVKEAKKGDNTAMEQLLSLAHTYVSYQCRKFMKTYDDAQDMTQEVLLVIYQKLDTLTEPAAFVSWAKRIAATRCMNAISRAHGELQLAEDADGNSFLETIEELDAQKIPEAAMDNAETARMVAELVDGLPEAQRICTYLYYYDELSIKEIADLTAATENTVKSRLNYARKAIKAGVLDHEKNGIKLYGLSPLPFLLYFLRSAAQAEASETAAAACVSNVLGLNAATVTTASATAISAQTAGSTAAAAGSAVGHFLSGKLIAGILAGLAVLGGVAAGSVHLVNEHAETVPAFICYHEWEEATCTAPKTCPKCGSTEGEALGHIWKDATCTAAQTCTNCAETIGQPLPHTWVEATCETAKTCSVCNTTDGEIPGHSWIEANYQAPKTCSVCNITDGTVLTPDFVAHGLQVIPAQMGVEYKYITTCYSDPTKKATGTLTMSDYGRVDGGGELEELDGYEWYTVTFEIEFRYDKDDPNAYLYGALVESLYANYYHISGWSEGGSGSTQFTLNYNGIDYSQCMLTTKDGHNNTGWRNFVNTCSCTFYWRVPVGYDGFILGYYDGGLDIHAGDLIYNALDENTLYFLFPNGG